MRFPRPCMRQPAHHPYNSAHQSSFSYRPHSPPVIPAQAGNQANLNPAIVFPVPDYGSSALCLTPPVECIALIYIFP